MISVHSKNTEIFAADSTTLYTISGGTQKYQHLLPKFIALEYPPLKYGSKSHNKVLFWKTE